MTPGCGLLAALAVLWKVTVTLGCMCDRYPWSAWSTCSKTCNYGTQDRHRVISYDEYYRKNMCEQLCVKQESRACNVEACPIHCQLSEFGHWSPCSPCAKKQFRTRSLVRPAQFGGQDCSETLMEDRACHPTTECRIEKVDCGTKFTCDSGRCIDPKLRCNSQNDCGDNSDERHCARISRVCNRVYESVPGAELMANGFDAVAESMRGAVLDNMFFGDQCVTNRSREDRKWYRIPANVESVHLKVEYLEDFKEEAEPAQSEPVELSSEASSSQSHSDHSSGSLWIPIFFSSRRSRTSSGSSSFRTAVKASQKKDSKFFRVHQVVGVSTFRTKQSDLYLSEPFLRFLNDLPLDYNYALYRQVFQLFGTHYFGSGTLGGVYDLLYQYDREELKNSGFTDSESSGCIASETSVRFLLFFSSRSVSRTCYNNKMSEKYEGSFLKASERSISMVRGGRAEYTAALAWERQGAAPDSTTYKNWMESTKDNPTIVDYELLPILELVRGFPCAVTKRRHLQRALVEYLEAFDSCKCAPCPNNGRPVLSGTECLCVCQTGTYGSNCEKRAPDYTSEAVDGRWSCWGPWSTCDSSMRRHRVRECNNPAPLRGGKPCAGNNKQEQECYISIFQKQDVCISDDELEKESEQEEAPGSPGCRKPRPPANSYLRMGKQRYDFGDQEEVVCHSGYEMEGYQYFRCLPDGKWSEFTGTCLKKVCARPDLPADMTLQPRKDEYKIGDGIVLNCAAAGTVPSAPRFYTCGRSLTWDPPLPSDIHCENEKPFVPDTSCRRGERKQGSQCVCIPREECSPYRADLCVLDAGSGSAVMKSACALHAGRCHGDRLYFLSEGACEVDEPTLEWARFRARLSNQSQVQEPCGPDTCYEWETCSESKKCECRLPRDCPREGQRLFCLELKTGTRKTMNLCFTAAMKCARIQFEIAHEGEC
ncbi:hypothetical protein MATL_G00081340 [Megalops atlanticus]|uniref:Complement component C6 n=1 Tax=Megalops atlanticus TaxID=7932 RepID=A0A9D3Q3U3_MEGAT|nr:hypothetical protein MATL_G00081340 [Megalops atlanticus]